jgi:putative endonuclease
MLNLQKMTDRFFIYIIRCNDDTLYTGYTKDVSRRVKQHNSGIASKYTRTRRPVKLVYAEEHPDESSALKREYAIKQLTKDQKTALILEGRKKFKKLLKHDWYGAND